MVVCDGFNPTGLPLPPLPVEVWGRPHLAQSIRRVGVGLSFPCGPNFSRGYPLRRILFPGYVPNFTRVPPLKGISFQGGFLFVASLRKGTYP